MIMRFVSALGLAIVILLSASPFVNAQSCGAVGLGLNGGYSTGYRQVGIAGSTCGVSTVATVGIPVVAPVTYVQQVTLAAPLVYPVAVQAVGVNTSYGYGGGVGLSHNFGFNSGYGAGFGSNTSFNSFNSGFATNHGFVAGLSRGRQVVKTRSKTVVRGRGFGF